jgi:hypothetical protein
MSTFYIKKTSGVAFGYHLIVRCFLRNQGGREHFFDGVSFGIIRSDTTITQMALPSPTRSPNMKCYSSRDINH